MQIQDLRKFDQYSVLRSDQERDVARCPLTNRDILWLKPDVIARTGPRLKPRAKHMPCSTTQALRPEANPDDLTPRTEASCRLRSYLTHNPSLQTWGQRRTSPHIRATKVQYPTGFSLSTPPPELPQPTSYKKIFSTFFLNSCNLSHSPELPHQNHENKAPSLEYLNRQLADAPGENRGPG